MKHFHLGAISGAVANAVTGVVYAHRAAVWQYIQRFRFELAPVAGVTAAPAYLSLEMALQDVFTADYTGGTDISDQIGAGAANYAIAARIRDTQRILQASQIPFSGTGAGDIRIASTAALGGGGGGTPRTQPWSHRAGTLPVAATATGNVGALVLEWVNPTMGLEHNDPYQGCIALAPDTGFVVRIPVNAGASLTLDLAAEVEWLE